MFCRQIYVHQMANLLIRTRQNSLFHTDIHTRVICFEHDQGLQCKLYRENNSGILQTLNAKVVVVINQIRYNVGIIKLMHYIRGA